jgi:hypothetical protein
MVDGDGDGTGGNGDGSGRRLVRLISGDVAMGMGAWDGRRTERAVDGRDGRCSGVGGRVVAWKKMEGVLMVIALVVTVTAVAAGWYNGLTAPTANGSACPACACQMTGTYGGDCKCEHVPVRTTRSGGD